ncbi:MAG: hypothetical protein R3F48_13745 [Candidatus Zixiibacteriota bacterium]
MIIKSFTADTVAGALKRVRTELGGDAVILKTRKIAPEKQAEAGGRVEVTACLEKAEKNAAVVVPQQVAATVEPTAAPTIEIPESRIRHIPSEAIAEKLDFLLDVFQMPIRKGNFEGTIGRAFTALLRADIPEYMAHDIADKLTDRLDNNSDYAMVTSAAVELLYQQMPKIRDSYVFKPGHKIVLVGPAGSGKTSLMGRLAGYLVAQRKISVSLTSLDQMKVSAPEELQTYADILDVDRFEMPREIDRSLLEREGKDKITFIDTPALNTRDKNNIAIYAEKLARINADRVIGVFPAWCRTSDLFDILRAFRPLGLTELAFTMVDQTNRLGGVIAMSIQYGLPVSIFGTGRRPADINMLPDHRQVIANLFGGGEEQHHEE